MLRDLRLPGPRGEGLTGSADELVLNPLRRALGPFRAGLQAQLLLEVLAGGFDGLDAEMEGRRDLAHAPPLANQAKYHQFAVAELVEGRACYERWPGNEIGGEPGLELEREGSPGKTAACPALRRRVRTSFRF